MNFSSELLLIILCSLIILSYLFSIASKYIRIPSVLLLLFAGIVLHAIAQINHFHLSVPAEMVNGLGVVGLIIIVFEAGMDLELSKDKITVIRDSFLAALLILIFSAALISGVLYYWLREDLTKCIVYALPLSIMSSSIVLPSIHHLSKSKKEFLIYEASFSDVIGILLFDYFSGSELFTLRSIGSFSFSIIISIILSLVISFLLFLLLAKARTEVKFFLVFSLLILIYLGGKMLHLPSLLMILVFGLTVNNWEKIPFGTSRSLLPQKELVALRHLLHSITAETSFVVRTFFFVLFGFSIDLAFIGNTEVILIGSLIVLSLFLVRFCYLRFFFKTRLLPEIFLIPRGLVTIVLFYKIPTSMKLTNFDDDILFFVILATGIIMSIGMLLYKKKNEDIIEDPQFAERKDIL